MLSFMPWKLIIAVIWWCECVWKVRLCWACLQCCNVCNILSIHAD